MDVWRMILFRHGLFRRFDLTTTAQRHSNSAPTPTLPMLRQAQSRLGASSLTNRMRVHASSRLALGPDFGKVRPARAQNASGLA